MAEHLDQKILSKEEEEEDADAAAVKPTRSFRYEDYSTRRVFLRSYPLQWDWSPAPEEKKMQVQGGAAVAAKNGVAGGGGEEEDGYGEERIGRKWKRHVAVAVVEWGEEKLLLLRRVKKRLALYLIGCHYGHRRPALPFKSGCSSCTAAMLASSR